MEAEKNAIPMARWAELSPTNDVVLSGNRVLLLTTNYYSPVAIRIAGGYADGMTLDKKMQGETVRQSLGPDGVLGALLTSLDPGRQFVRFLVCPDSLPAFREITAEIAQRNRPASAKRRSPIRFTWDTWWDDIQFPLPSGSSGAGASGPVGVFGG